MHGQDLAEFANVARWREAVAVRPAVQRGMDVGKEMSVDPTRFSEDEKQRFRKMLFNNRAIALPDSGR